MPGFVAYAEGVVLRIADIEIPEIEQAFEFIGIGKFSAEIFMSPAYLADVEIAERVVGMPRRRQRIRGKRQVAVNLRRLIHKQVKLFDDAANAGSQHDRITDILADLAIGVDSAALEKVVAGSCNLEDVFFADGRTQSGYKFVSVKSEICRSGEKQLFDKIQFGFAEGANLFAILRNAKNLIPANNIEVSLADIGLQF